jgi:hypothetical protein
MKAREKKLKVDKERPVDHTVWAVKHKRKAPLEKA